MMVQNEEWKRLPLPRLNNLIQEIIKTKDLFYF
jgi:hypothetical protein